MECGADAGRVPRIKRHSVPRHGHRNNAVRQCVLIVVVKNDSPAPGRIRVASHHRRRVEPKRHRGNFPARAELRAENSVPGSAENADGELLPEN